jgi:hypothetical protein
VFLDVAGLAAQFEVAECVGAALGEGDAYPAASVELRTRPTIKEAPKMDEASTSSEGGAEAAIDEKPEAEQRTASAGTLRVTELDQGGSETRTLFGKFQEAGWAPRVGTATIPWREYETAAENRSLTWSGSVDNVSQLLDLVHVPGAAEAARQPR